MNDLKSAYKKDKEKEVKKRKKMEMNFTTK